VDYKEDTVLDPEIWHFLGGKNDFDSLFSSSSSKSFALLRIRGPKDVNPDKLIFTTNLKYGVHFLLFPRAATTVTLDLQHVNVTWTSGSSKGPVLHPLPYISYPITLNSGSSSKTNTLLTIIDVPAPDRPQPLSSDLFVLFCRKSCLDSVHGLAIPHTTTTPLSQ
jgi:hypothetical protein